MGYVGNKGDRRSRLTQAISTWYPLPGNNFHRQHSLPREHKGRGEDRARLFLPQFDLVLDLMCKIDAAEGENDFGGQFFTALEAAGFQRVANRLFDLPLRGDAGFLQKSAQAGVENVFIHESLLEV